MSGTRPTGDGTDDGGLGMKESRREEKVMITGSITVVCKKLLLLGPLFPLYAFTCVIFT